MPISSLTKRLALVLLLPLGLLIFIVSTSNYSKERKNSIENLTRITNLPGLALSTSYLEKRVIYYEDYSNTLYPKMKNYSQMDFVYDK